MKLTLEKIKKLTVGAAMIFKAENGDIGFSKCTEKQIKACGDGSLVTLPLL